ncbi:type IV pilin protein [Ferrimonas lipolytica]|uniref:Type IV pilin protein n=1 Tax=Ferrimonas lipolytica TaxID=2724191 RepID=A0A6H1UDK6_9GAMM|nr:type IV pilin protein [Ferrimonas lipolytica]QIZ77124.1 type IV pilin protein [Ferrimonas lipolytica]
MNRSRGFTLIEMMIAVTILGILASIAYPSYTDYVQSSRRALAKTTLVEASQRLERYYAQNLTFTGAVSGSTLTIFTTSGDFDEYYSLTASAAANSYSLTAAPAGSQSTDECGSLSLNSSNQTSASASHCW